MKAVQIKAPNFCAGFVSVDGVIHRAAPIIGYMVGWSEERAREYIKQRGWKASIVPERKETE